MKNRKFHSIRASEGPMSKADTPPKTVTACVLIIGNEILSGSTQNANLAFLAKGLNEAGIRLREARVIPDDADIIVNTVNELRRSLDYVFTTGDLFLSHILHLFDLILIGHLRLSDLGVMRVIRGTERERIGAAVEELKALIRTLGGDPQEGLAED